MNAKINLKIKKFVTEHKDDIAQIFLIHNGNDKLHFGCRCIQKDYKDIAEYECNVNEFAILLTFIINDPFFDKFEGNGSLVVEFGAYR